MPALNSVEPIGSAAPNTLKTNAGYIQLLIWGLLGFVAAQRFTLPQVTGYLCLVPLIGAILCFTSNTPRRNSLLLLALLWSVDNAVLEYGATHFSIRYAIYIAAVLALAQGTAILRQRLLFITLLAAFYSAVTIFHADMIRILQFWRDMQITVLLIILFGLRPKKAFNVDIPLTVAATTGYLISENINFFAFQSAWYKEYMSYSTTKFLIVFPSLLALLSGRVIVANLLILLTIPVLVGYAGRVLFLLYIMAIFGIAAFMILKRGYLRYLLLVGGAAAIIVITASQLDIYSTLESYKSLSSILLILEHGINSVQFLDPVRYAESAMYFQLPVLELLFGRGWGAGLADTGGFLGFVAPNQFAFSIQELNSNIYYGFHDVWVDIGLRFGLLFFALFMLWLLLQVPSRDYSLLAIWVVSLIGVIAAFYGTGGLIATFLLIRIVTTKSTQI